MLLQPTRSLTYPELLTWYLSRPIFSPEEGTSSNSTEIRPGGDPSGRVTGVGEFEEFDDAADEVPHEYVLEGDNI